MQNPYQSPLAETDLVDDEAAEIPPGVAQLQHTSTLIAVVCFALLTPVAAGGLQFALVGTSAPEWLMVTVAMIAGCGLITAVVISFPLAFGSYGIDVRWEVRGWTHGMVLGMASVGVSALVPSDPFATGPLPFPWPAMSVGLVGIWITFGSYCGWLGRANPQAPTLFTFAILSLGLTLEIAYLIGLRLIQVWEIEPSDLGSVLIQAMPPLGGLLFASGVALLGVAALRTRFALQNRVKSESGVTRTALDPARPPAPQ